MWYITLGVLVVVIALLGWRRWYRRNHITMVIVDYIDGDFHPRSPKTFRFPPKWYKRQQKRWKSEDIAVDTEGP